MADPLVIFDDLEMFLTRWYKGRLDARPESFCTDVRVSRLESTAKTPPARQLIIRDDGTTRQSFLTGEATIGLTVLAATKTAPQVAKDLGRIVLALASQVPAPDRRRLIDGGDADETLPGSVDGGTGGSTGPVTNGGVANPRNPFSALLDYSGPVLVTEESTFARVYSSVTFAVAGYAL